jgi:hypothetical protein
VHEDAEIREPRSGDNGLLLEPDLLRLRAVWASLSPELKEVMLALPTLPEPIKRGIVTMVQALAGGR